MDINSDWEVILRESFLFHNITLENMSPEDLLLLTGGIPGPNNVTELLKLQTQKSKEREIIIRYVAPLILSIGLLGNLMSGLVLLQRQMRKLSTNIYLAVLSITDITVLFSGLFLVWLSVVFEINIKTTSEFLCKFMNLLAVSSSQFSSWLLVCVSVERFVVLRHPMKARAFSRTLKTWKCIFCILSIITVGNMHLFWTVKFSGGDGTTKPKTCGIANQRKTFGLIWPWIDALVYSFIPSLLLIIVNSMSISTLVKQTSVLSLRKHVHRRNSMKNSNRNTTMTLCILSLMFIVTTTPMCFLLIARSVIKNNFTFVNYWILRTISDILMYCDHSFNFFLYCVSGSKFRSKLMEILFLVSKKRSVVSSPRNMLSLGTVSSKYSP